MSFSRIVFLTAALAVALCGTATDAHADEGILPPDLPAACQDLEVPPGHEVAFRAYAIGVQIYRWNGAGWQFVGPEANLYADANFHGKVGTHFGGPTWASNSGSYVIGGLLAGCPVDASAVNWLLLERRASEGPGIFGDVTYIQRVSTVGGVSPTESGSFVHEEKRVPYTAEYYLYRAESW